MDGVKLRWPHVRGFTLIELLVALTIAALLAVMAVPSFSDLMLNSARTSHINTLVAHFHYARSTAAKERTWVVLCKSEDGERCTSAGGWEQGWIMFADRNRSKQHEANEPLLTRAGPFDGCTLNFRAFGSNNYVIYHPRGDTRSNGTFTHCDRRGSDYARAMILYKSGRIRTSGNSANGDGLSCP